MQQKYADIIIDISHEAIDKNFQYAIPSELSDIIEVGMEVIVPFGKGNTKRKGYVIGLSDMPNYDVDKIKYIMEISKKSLPIESKLIKLAFWIRKTYGSTMINALKTVMPVRNTVAKRKAATLTKVFDLETNIVEELSEEQKNIVLDFEKDIANKNNKVYLLHGITGSGKTEIYINAIMKTIITGKQAIVLIPEIALTHQTVSRFKKYFKSRVTFINSKMNKGEKFREFERAKNNEVDIVIGPRTALFTPFSNLGLIIVDEEHDIAYKSDTSPKYHAREVAIKRGELEGASIILGSATPSVESYMKANLGEYKLWELSKRANGSNLATVELVDLKEEMRLGNRSIISNALYNEISLCLENNEQVMLFINRRGYNSFISCRACGNVIKCPRCDVSLSKHSNGKMMCHYCGYENKEPSECPICKSKLIGGYGTGTEKVENEINKLFPSAKTLRLDKDTTKGKNDQGEIIFAFANQKADILIGTQMIVKGHDFSNVTLVGIILADLSLFENDYRAPERTFDLLTQAAGRAGRGKKDGKVVIQTYQPSHYAISCAANQDYERFFDMEISVRRLLRYPPVYNMMAILILSKNQADALEVSIRIHSIIKESLKGDKRCSVIGPCDGIISKINEIYRRVVYVKHLEYNELIRIRDIIDEKLINDKDLVMISYDFNPLNMY